MSKKTCTKCGFTTEEDDFAPQPKSSVHIRSKIYRMSICRWCRQDATHQSLQSRAHDKARVARRNHAKNYGMPPDEFGRLYDWDIDHMAHDVLHAFENYCPDCRHPYKEMGHGLGDVTFDILNHNLPPYYTTNVRICCASCNKRKSKKPPEERGVEIARGRARQAFLQSKPGTELKPQHMMESLFDETAVKQPEPLPPLLHPAPAPKAEELQYRLGL